MQLTGGGSANSGTVYKLSRSGNGWVATVLHSFVGGDDGSWPEAGLVFDAAGNLYGTTSLGGGSSLCQFGCGTVFQLAPTSGGGWTTSVIHAFGVVDGAYPYDSLVIDNAGNLYGTTMWGGASVYGTAFKLMPSTGGNWRESVLHNFTGGRDGGNPEDSVMLDATGNIYGCAAHGGNSKGPTGMGLVFEIVP